MSTVEDLSREIADLAAHLDAATHRLLTCIRQFDEAGGWYEQGADSCAHWLAWRIGLDPATAREKVRVARALGKLPAIDEALRVGKLSYAKARALTRVATPETEAKLLEVAVVATGAQLGRLCRGYRRALAPDDALAPEERSVRRRDLPGGMVKLEIVLAPDEADLVLRALDRAREVVCGETGVSAETRQRDGGQQEVSAETSAPGSTWPSRADGVVALAENFLAGNLATGNGGERFQVMVHVDQDPLAPDGVAAATLDDGTRVSAETFRRIACDCGVVAVAGELAGLNIGRRARSIPPAIRRALTLRDRGCRFPGCTHSLPARSPHPALAARGRDQRDQPCVAVHLPPPPGPRGRLERRPWRRRRIGIHRARRPRADYRAAAADGRGRARVAARVGRRPRSRPWAGQQPAPVGWHQARLRLGSGGTHRGRVRLRAPTRSSWRFQTAQGLLQAAR